MRRTDLMTTPTVHEIPAEHIETIRVQPAGAVCYALVRDDVACELTVKRAIELQREGVPYRTASPMRHAADFSAFYI
jgi:hypothetical protein